MYIYKPFTVAEDKTKVYHFHLDYIIYIYIYIIIDIFNRKRFQSHNSNISKY